MRYDDMIFLYINLYLRTMDLQVHRYLGSRSLTKGPGPAIKVGASDASEHI